MSGVMEVTEIKKYLAHRYPFLLVDRVLECEPGKNIRCIKNVTSNEPHFEGHFPDFPIMPGVMIIEAMAQATGLLGFLTMGIEPDSDTLYILASIDKVKFRKQVIPGDQLELRAELTKQKGKIWKFSTAALVDGKRAATAEITCVVTGKD